jgi:predicted lactoylglutathione lyase
MNTIKLGAFSISLTVNDIRLSKEFYENLGFTPFGGNLDQNWLIMKNGNALIGLFQGMFNKNIITFNPGWDENANNVDDFNDVREIQKMLMDKGIALTNKVEENTSGPGYITLTDPDGNEILIDQHR